MSVPKNVDLNRSYVRDKFKYRNMNMKNNYSLNDIDLKKFKKIENFLEPQPTKKKPRKSVRAKSERMGRAKRKLRRTIGGGSRGFQQKNEDISIDRIDEVDPKRLEQILIPKFKKLGLSHILKVYQIITVFRKKWFISASIIQGKKSKAFTEKELFTSQRLRLLKEDLYLKNSQIKFNLEHFCKKSKNKTKLI